MTNDALLPPLELLYGKEAAARTLPRVRALIGKSGAATEKRSRLPLSQHDAMLIAYADQVRGKNEAPLRTLTSFCNRRLRNLLSAVHLLPFFPWSSDDGFAVKDYHAIDPDSGGWGDVEALARDFDLMFDAVFNHMSAQSEWFADFLADKPERRDFFVTVEGDPDLSAVVRPRALPLLTEFQGASGPRKVWTTFSADQVDLNFANPGVLLAILDVMLFYVAKGARYLRLDAIAYLWKEPGTSCIHLPQTHAAIRLMRAVLDEVAPGVLLVTETNVPHKDNVSYFGDGTDEAQMVYNFALPPLVLHTLQTGDSSALTRWAADLTTPSDGVTFFNFLASHDGVGVNPVRGILKQHEINALVDRTRAHNGFVSMKNNPDGTQSPYEMNINYFDALNDPANGEPLALQVARFLCAQSILLSLRGVPGIYFHSLFGSRGDREAAVTSVIPRRINREKLSLERLESELDDPGSRRALVFGGFRSMLTARKGDDAFHPLAPQRVIDAGPGVFALLRETADGSHAVLCVHNVTNETREAACALPASYAAPSGCRDLLASGTACASIAGGRVTVTLSPCEARWLRLDREEV
jgi:sucrose phosphorylase